MISDITVTGMAEIGEAFDRFSPMVRDRLLKKAVKAGADPIASAAASMLRRRTGALQGSLDVKISSKNVQGSAVYCIIGPRRGIKIPVRVVQSGKHAGELVVAIPTRYAHLVEFGHRIVDEHGKTIGNVAPVPFMRVAWANYGGEVALATIATTLTEGIAREKI